MTLTTGKDDGNRRLDRILRKALPDIPLSGIHRLLRKGRVLVNGRPATGEDRVAGGSVITLPDSAAGMEPPPRRARKPPSPSLPLNILREEADLLFLNKPSGLAVHGPGSLDDAVGVYLAETARPSLSFRPGPLHRLDKPTSGIIVFSKTLAGARFFSALLREGRIKKQYLAVVEGLVEEPAVWEDLLVRDRGAQKTFTAGMKEAEKAAKPARTRIRPLAVGTGTSPAEGGERTFSLILAEIETGRTHQIRAQAAARGFPLAGDTKYGGRPQAGGFLLHAWKLDIPDPAGNRKPLRITAPLPDAFTRRIRELFPGYTIGL
jgi:23S rRNA pseudouridine955/2504/2580 synthase